MSVLDLRDDSSLLSPNKSTPFGENVKSCFYRRPCCFSPSKCLSISIVIILKDTCPWEQRCPFLAEIYCIWLKRGDFFYTICTKSYIFGEINVSLFWQNTFLSIHISNYLSIYLSTPGVPNLLRGKGHKEQSGQMTSLWPLCIYRADTDTSRSTLWALRSDPPKQKGKESLLLF